MGMYVLRWSCTNFNHILMTVTCLEGSEVQSAGLSQQESAPCNPWGCVFVLSGEGFGFFFSQPFPKLIPNFQMGLIRSRTAPSQSVQEQDKNEAFETHDTENLSLHLALSMVQLPLEYFWAWI